MEIAGRTAVVTGGAGGIGKALAGALRDAGADVVIADLDEARTTAAADELGVRGFATDVVDVAALERLLAFAGPVDVFCANAGIGLGAGMGASEAEWDLALDVNVRAHVRAARLLLPDWLERGEGYFVSTASAAGLLTQIGSPTYSVSKHGAVAFAEWLAITYGQRGVRVSCLCPMGVNTDMLTSGLDAEGDHNTGAHAVTAAGAVLEPAEVAARVLEAIAAEQFLILPHAEVLEYWRRKTSDYDRWISGMQRLQATAAAAGGAS